MIDIKDKLYSDFEAVRSIAIVPLMLEVICRTTKMGFAAVARVTEDRWVACRVRDEIQFGLQEGGELKVETTICDEIRDSNTAVVIDHVAESADFCNHHTPAMYGFQSYISFPIILRNGEFFGTLCAIDPNPAKLNNPEIMGTFRLFTELLSFHLHSQEMMERSEREMHVTNRELKLSHNENLQYRQISNHNISEQLRKITIFSDLLMDDKQLNDTAKVKSIAAKINSFTVLLTEMFQHVSDFSGIAADQESFEKIPLNKAVEEATKLLSLEIETAAVGIITRELPAIYGNQAQLTQLFFHLISYVIMFSKQGSNPSINIYADANTPGLSKVQQGLSLKPTDYCEIVIEISNTGIDQDNLNSIFDIFVHLDDEEQTKKYRPGLAYSKKIVHNHKGFISAKLVSDSITSMSIILPLNKA